MLKSKLLLFLLAGMLWLPATVLLSQETTPLPGETQPNVTLHVVQPGENLFRIALRYGLTTEFLAQYNSITNPSVIQVGQRLLIPLDDETDNLPLTHVVQPGETLGGIARLYNLAPEALASQNNIVDVNTLYVGQTLVVGAILPAGEEAAPELIDSGVRHTIAAGETLSGIAEQYDVRVSDLQTINSLEDASTIFAGQQLIIPGAPAEVSAVELPAPIMALEIQPLVFTTGQTARVRLTTSTPVTVTTSFLSSTIPVIDNQTDYLMFIGVAVGTEPGVYPLLFSVTPQGGQPVDYTVNVQVVTGQYGTQYLTLPEDRVALLAPSVEENEISLLQGITRGFSAERFFEGPMGLPAAAVMNSPFGVSRSYNGGPVDRYHNGADFAGAPGSLVLAAAPGRVVMADTLHIRGMTLMIDHGWGIYTVYAHLAERFVNLGDFVITGQQIGAVGSSGRATGAHLHWELWVNGVAVDPMQWVRQAFP